MKAIVCEMCNSNDVVKQDGLYVCQSCGTKYSPEDARKLMVEITGKVNVSGSTVKIDNSDLADNYRVLARRAAGEENYEKAAEYYEKLAVNRPNDWEACFYSVYYPAFVCSIDEIENYTNNVTNRIPNIMSIIQDTIKEDEQKEAYSEVAERVSELREALYTRARNNYFAATGYPIATYKNQCFAIYQMEIVMATSIWETFDDSDLSIEHLQVCDNEESNISREYIYELMAQIDPETADVAKEQYEKEHATAKRHKLFSILIPIALGIVLFILASVLNKVPGFAALYVLGAIAIIAGIINLVYPLLKSDD